MLSVQQRADIITYLTANCACWKGQGDDRLLNGLPDEKLLNLKETAEKDIQAIVVANTAVTGFTSDDGTSYRINPETGRWEKRQPTVNKAGKQKTEESEEEEDEEGDTSNMVSSKSARNGKVTNNTEEVEERTASTKKSKSKKDNFEEHTERRPARTIEEYIRNAPTHIRQQLENDRTYVDQIINSRKEDVIGKLLINVGEADRVAYQEWLMQKPIQDLEYMLALVPKTGQERGTQQNNKKATRSSNTDDMLIQQTLSWEELGSNQHDELLTTNSSYDVEPSEDELIRQLPPRLRDKVLNATIIENRERQALIDSLVTNVEDEETERQLRREFSGMSVSQLRSLTALSSKKEPTRYNYFGASPPPPQNRQTEVPGDDILPVPSLGY